MAPTTKKSSSSNRLPRSVPLILARRVEGQLGFPGLAGAGGLALGTAFKRCMTRQFAPQCLLQYPRLVTPQTTNLCGRRSASTVAINALHVDRNEHRFVLTGGDDAIVSAYDLSYWGSEQYLESAGNTRRRKKKINNRSDTSSATTTATTATRLVHKPIASSQREPPRTTTASTMGVDIPSGHSSPVSQVQWYPVDSGAFLSSSKDGSLLVWDTESMCPVAHCMPFSDTNNTVKGIHSFHLSPVRVNTAVVSSLHDASLKLVDIRSGACSHTLVGHKGGGISSTQWAPHSDVILASGGIDGTVRLWDIRKAGSRSCIAILNQDVRYCYNSDTQMSSHKPYRADYGHLPKPSAALLSHADDVRAGAGNKKYTHKKFSTAVTTSDVAPNNFRPSQSSAISSHNGPVSALSFGSAQDGHFLISASQDGNMHVWDLRGNGHLMPLRFLAPGLQPAVPRQRRQVPILLTQYCNFASSPSAVCGEACWIGNGTNLLGYSLEQGGAAQQILQGHLNDITAIDAIGPTLLTAGKDGMILMWGKSNSRGDYNHKQKIDQDTW